MLQSMGVSMLARLARMISAPWAENTSICCALASCMARTRAKLYGSWYCMGMPVLAVNGSPNAVMAARFQAPPKTNAVTGVSAAASGPDDTEVMAEIRADPG